MEAAPTPPKSDDADVTIYLKLALTVLYYIAYPVYKVFHILCLLLLQLLRPVWAVVRFVTLPLAYLAAFTGSLLSLPFRLIAKFETAYIFLGIAVLIGLGTGVLLALLSAFSSSSLQLDKDPQTDRLRSLSAFRAAREKRRYSASPSPSPPPLPPGRPARIKSPTSPLSPLSPLSPGGFRSRGHALPSTILGDGDS